MTEGDSDARAARDYEHARTLYVQVVETDGRRFPFQAASLRRSWRELARRRPDLVERMVGDWELWELLSGLGHEVLEVRDETGTDVIAVSCDGDTLPPPPEGRE